jgi:hypothetical protein
MISKSAISSKRRDLAKSIGVDEALVFDDKNRNDKDKDIVMILTVDGILISQLCCNNKFTISFCFVNTA